MHGHIMCGSITASSPGGGGGDQTQGDKRRLALQLWGAGRGEVAAGSEFPHGTMEPFWSFWERLYNLVTLKNHSTGQFKRVNFAVCKLQLNFLEKIQGKGVDFPFQTDLTEFAIPETLGFMRRPRRSDETQKKKYRTHSVPA